MEVVDQPDCVGYSTGQMSSRDFMRRLRWLIFLAWNIPPVFGLGFILLISVLQPAQLIGILTTPLEPAYILCWAAFSIWFLPKQVRPLAEWLDGKPDCDPETVLKAVRRFPLVFWATFLVYLILAPVSVIEAAKIYTDFVSTPVTWFRIELVALIVSIIVGLPIFFLIFDLFGEALGNMKLTQPIVKIRTKVFLIGALVPLLIDTMLVQYYWTRTGYFSFETFYVWILLEVLAIGGSMIFARSFRQSLGPMQSIINAPRPLSESRITELMARSTDEIGVLTANYRDLLEKQWIQGEIQKINNSLLRSAGSEEATAIVFERIVAICCQATNTEQAFILLHDTSTNELVGVAQSGSTYRPEGHYRIQTNEVALSTWIYNQHQTAVVCDALNDPRLSQRLTAQFNIRSAIGVPLQLDNSVIGVLMAVTHDGPRQYSPRDIAIFEGLARETAYALNAQQLLAARTRAEKAHLEQQELFGLLLNSTAEAIYGIDLDGICTFVNPSCLKMLAYTRDDEVVGKQIHALIHHTYPDGRPYPIEECKVRLATHKDEIVHVDDEVFWRSDGSSFPVEYWAHPMYRDDKLIGAVVTFVDITERKQAEMKMEHLAYHDHLTHLPNRQLFMDRLQQALLFRTRMGRTGALLLIDLDNFKTLNDTLGHDMGDLLLQQVALRLVSCVRDGDTVARLGGDEFVVLLEGLSEKELEAAGQTESIGEKILATLRHPYSLDGHQFHCTSSVGAVLFIDHQKTQEELLKQADIAMYQAKKLGRNNLRFFDPRMQVAINARSSLESELRKAIENRQFHLHYQVQVDSAGHPIGAEALIRWMHPERGIVSPDQFIPLSEETGLILPIGQWVLDTACTQLHAWQQDVSTRDLVLSINVSAIQFRQANFLNQVKDTVQRHAINPVRLKLELTEGLLLENVEDTIATMSALKHIGIRISMDDFGTGYSSIQYLKKLPLDEIKIDQSFVRDIATDPDDAAIVQTIIAMTETLGLEVIAEGVETEQQREFLELRGCHHFQGYLFGRPVPIEQFRVSLLSQR